MPKRGIDSCLDVIGYLRAKGFEKEVPAAEILKAIHLIVGITQGTRNRYFHLLREFGLIIPAGEGIFKIDAEKADELNI